MNIKRKISLLKKLNEDHGFLGAELIKSDAIKVPDSKGKPVFYMIIGLFTYKSLYYVLACDYEKGDDETPILFSDVSCPERDLDDETIYEHKKDALVFYNNILKNYSWKTDSERKELIENH